MYSGAAMNLKACSAIALLLMFSATAAVAGRGHSSGRRSSSRSYTSHSRSYSSGRSHSYSSRSYSTRSSSRPVHVRSYTRRNGTAVAAHTRSYAGTGSRSYSSQRSSSSYSRITHATGRSATHSGAKRSAAAKDSFKRQSPCPSTGRSSGACPGYVIDHVRPLACGGADAASNMQWQTIAAGKAKDKTERRGCR
ncbi:MAG: endonuclease [Acidobacteriales bacterium]|nr:endonuclease [Terriglobales bacterium]